MKAWTLALTCTVAAGIATATPTVNDFESLTEGFQGPELIDNGVRFYDVNNVDGVYPDGNTFIAGDDPIDGLGTELIVERATFFYNDFPSWGSPSNALTFGRAFIGGDNLTIGPLSTVSMDLDVVADSASVDIAFYENGPWGGIVIHFEAYLNGGLVDADSYTLSDLGGRDNGAVTTLSVGGGDFDTLRMYSTLGSDFTAPRIMIDDLTINSAPAACTGDIADDFGFIGPDGMVSFGDFLALLGLIGPCPGGTPGCTGDIADDFGFLGGDGMVSFGDFLALLGLIGPCP